MVKISFDQTHQVFLVQRSLPFTLNRPYFGRFIFTEPSSHFLCKKDLKSSFCCYHAKKTWTYSTTKQTGKSSSLKLGKTICTLNEPQFNHLRGKVSAFQKRDSKEMSQMCICFAYASFSVPFFISSLVFFYLPLS